MPPTLDPNAIDLRQFIRPGDTIFVSEGAGEPQTLVRALIEQRAALGGVHVFLGYGAANSFAPEHADHIQFTGYGALGTFSKLADCLDIVPTSLGQLPRVIQSGALRCDVVLASITPTATDAYGYGASCLLIGSAAQRARVVLGELNAQSPCTTGATLDASRITALVETDIALPTYRAKSDATALAVARAATQFVKDGSTIQLGIGAVPDALPTLLTDRRDLGVHSGIISDGIIDLIKSGIITNARKTAHRGVTITGMVLGSADAYSFIDRNESICIEAAEITHTQAGAIENLVSVNSAIEVDLFGQVNAESVGERYVGAIGGQPDFVRAAQTAPAARSIIALPATAQDGRISRIRATSLSRVTTPRHDVDIIATEFGAVELAGKSTAERARLLISIAHPDHREALERALRDGAA